MKRILTVILMIVLLGLSACAVPATEDAEPSPTPDDQITDTAQTEATVPPFPGNALTGPIQTYTVTDNDQIIEILTDAMISRRLLVNFDMHTFVEPVSNYGSMLREDYDSITRQNPDLKYVERVRSNYYSERRLLTVEIEYMYFIHGQDIFCMYSKPCLYVVLDKKVLREGETASVTIVGEDADRYRFQLFSSDSSILHVDADNSITALKDGVADLDISFRGKGLDFYYVQLFSISALPRDTPEIDDIAGLLAVAREGLNKRRQPIFITNDKLKITDMKNVLNQLGYGYISCRLIESPTCIYNGPADWDIPFEECIEKINAAEQKADEIIAAIIRPGMSELEKETAIYDYLILNTQYDTRVSDDSDHSPFDARTAYGPIINGKGVSAGYAYALQMLLNRADITCITVEGTAGVCQMWNIVKIDGGYYHADATIDSYLSHKYNRLSHIYFNISDAQMGLDHVWDASVYPPCPDTLPE